MAETIDPEGVTRLFFSTVFHDRNPVPRVCVDCHPGIHCDARSCLWDTFVTTSDYGCLSIKSQPVSRDAVHTFKQPADGVIRAADRIMRDLPTGFVE